MTPIIAAIPIAYVMILPISTTGVVVITHDGTSIDQPTSAKEESIRDDMSPKTMKK